MDSEEVRMAAVIITDSITMATMTKPTHQATLHVGTRASRLATMIHIDPTTNPRIRTLLVTSTTEDDIRQRGV